MKGRLLTSSIVLALLASFVLVIPPHRVAAASATVADIANPDNYTCGQSGFITFERMPDLTNLSSGAINGVQFTTTNGFSWVVSDMATGNYNGKYPNGSYTAQGTHVAWLGPDQGAGRIDFVGGPASYFSLLTSNFSQVYLDAYKADGTLLATAGPAASNINTGHMAELKIVRDTADMAYVIVHDTGNFFIVDSICTNAAGVPNQGLDDFKQNRNADGSKVPWADNRLYENATCGTMEGYGCAITTVTDVLSSYGLKNLPAPDGSPMDPGHLNHFFAQRAGTHSGCYIFWEPAIKSVNYTLLKNDYARNNDGSLATPLATRIKDIDDALNAGNLVIAGVGGHYIVLYQKASAPAADGSPDYLIVDPLRHRPFEGPFRGGSWSGKLLSETYGTINHLESVLQVVVIQNKAPKPGRSWTVVAHSPVELLVTDPNGAQTGFKPATGTYIQDIPESTYGLQQGLIDDDGILPPQPDVVYFGQNSLAPGIYTVDVIGTGSGPYSLDFGIDGGADDTSLRTVTGVATPGVVETYTVNLTEGQPLGITLLVKIDIKPGELPNPISTKSRGVIPVAILSTPTLNANAIDPQSVKFGPLGASAALYSIQDVNSDGLDDLVLQFRTQQTGLRVGDTQACISGITTAGLDIFGCEQVRVTR